MHDQRWSRLQPDLVAGLTLGVMVVPQAMAYAALAGMPPTAGLYTSLVSLVVYAGLGGSRHLAFGPVALISLLTAAAITPLAGGDPARYIVLAGALAVLVGLVHLIIAAARAAAVVELISHPVIVGFTAAAGLIIALSQVRDLTAVPVGRSERFVEGVVPAVQALPDAHAPTLLLGLVSIALLLLGRWRVPRLPVALLVVIVTIALDLEARGIAVVGDIPRGLPALQLPLVTLAEVRALLPNAVVIAAISFAETISIAKAMAARSRDRVHTGRELLGSGTANVLAGLVGGFPVAGSFTGSAVLRNTGARSRLAGGIAATVVLLTLLVLSPALAALPRAVLAAIVVVAAAGLVDLRAARATVAVDRADGLVLLLTFVATLSLGIELGLLSGVAASLVVHVVRGMRPALTELGRVPGTPLFRSTARYETFTDPSGVVLRLDGPLDFLSVQQVVTRLRRLAADRPELRWLVLDASAVTGMDSTGVHALHDLQRQLADAEVTLHLATLRGPQRDVVQRAGLWEALIEGSCHADVPAALEAIGLPESSPLRGPGADEHPPDVLL